jgi:hypothetical protein
VVTKSSDFLGTIRIIDAHRDSQRFVAGADQKLMAFLELESQARRA